MVEPRANYGITRIDQPEKKHHGFYVRTTHRGNTHQKYFPDKSSGGKTKALKLARAYRDELLAKMPKYKQEKEDVRRFGQAFIDLRTEVQYCSKCYNLSDESVCHICKNPARDQKTLCVVEDLRDVIAIENTGQYKGLYHVLGGIISPMDGIGPADLNIDALVNRVKQEDTREIIMAISTTMEGDTTNFYLYKKLKDSKVKLSAIERGVAIGDELEYADEITLGRSLMNRVPYESTLAG
jgi:recombination protein RecR